MFECVLCFVHTTLFPAVFPGIYLRVNIPVANVKESTPTINKYAQNVLIDSCKNKTKERTLKMYTVHVMPNVPHAV